MRRPLMFSTNRERMPEGSGMAGRMVIVDVPGHGRTCSGHPRLLMRLDCKDVDARDKPGHDDDRTRRVAKPTGRANARPMISSACPPFSAKHFQSPNGGHGAKTRLCPPYDSLRPLHCLRPIFVAQMSFH